MQSRAYLILVMTIFFASSLLSQKGIPTFDGHHKNIYGEFLGSHLLLGANFDMRLNKGRLDGIGFRAGIGGLSATVSDNNNTGTLGLVTLPIELNHVVGKKRSGLITGVGILPIYATISIDGEITDYEFIRGQGFGLAGGFLTFGYRLQPKRTGLMFQFHWNPLITRNEGFQTGWFGLGLGIGFK